MPMSPRTPCCTSIRTVFGPGVIPCHKGWSTFRRALATFSYSAKGKDYETWLASMAVSIGASDRLKLQEQLRRYDRCDRSPNRRFQRFIDDDSDFGRTDWPEDILFPGSGTVHVADLEVVSLANECALVRAQAFLSFGRFDGFEFDFVHTKGEEFKRWPIASSFNELAKLGWSSKSVKLFLPFGPTPSLRKFTD